MLGLLAASLAPGLRETVSQRNKVKSHRSEYPAYSMVCMCVHSSLPLTNGACGHTQGYSLFLIQSISLWAFLDFFFFFCLVVFLKVIIALALFVFGNVWLRGDFVLHLPETVVLGNPLETPLPLMPSLQWLPCQQDSQPLAWNSVLALSYPYFCMF